MTKYSALDDWKTLRTNQDDEWDYMMKWLRNKLCRNVSRTDHHAQCSLWGYEDEFREYKNIERWGSTVNYAAYKRMGFQYGRQIGKSTSASWLYQSIKAGQ